MNSRGNVVIIVMGGVNQRTSEIWLTIESNSKGSQRQLFDFTKDHNTLTSVHAFFPFYLHHYQRTNQVTYSLIQDCKNSLCRVETQDQLHQNLKMVKYHTPKCSRIWKLVSDGDSQYLEEGDFIKLGRVELQIKELRFLQSKKSLKELRREGMEQSSPQMSLSKTFNYSPMKGSDIYSLGYSRMKESDLSMAQQQHLRQSKYTAHSNNEKLCRICFDGTTSKFNPLLNVCLCAGSVKHIHHQCLLSWIRSRTGRVETSHCIYYHYEPLECEICKESLSSEVVFEGRKYSLFEPEQIHPPYARLEHTSEGKVFQILVRLEESISISIGRGPENELNLNDSSISRNHAFFFYTAQQLFLKGLSSKYGSFVQLSKQLSIGMKPLKLLVANHLLSLDRRCQQANFLQENCCGGPSQIHLRIE